MSRQALGRLRTTAAALGALVLLGAAGCGDSSPGSKGGELDMGIAVANISLNFAHEMVLGAESAASHAGKVNFKAVGPPDTDGPAEVQLFQRRRRTAGTSRRSTSCWATRRPTSSP